MKEPAAVAELNEYMRAYVDDQCGGDWDRVTVDPVTGAITIHNNPVRGDRTVKKPATKTARRVTKLPDVRPRTRKPPEPTGKGLRARGEKAAPPAQRVHEKPPGAPPAPPEAKSPPTPAGPSPAALERLRQLPPPNEDAAVKLGAPTTLKEPKTDKYRPGVYKRDAQQLVEIISRDGFQGAIRVTDDILAMNGMPFEDMVAAVRNPTRVEIRPETKGKRYPVLGLSRGDIQVIIGFFIPSSPAVIAVYWTHLLGHDQYHQPRVGGGGGGAKTGQGNPRTPNQLSKRLRDIGVELAVDGKNPDLRSCTYEGQDVGQISLGVHRTKNDIESDWNRIQRKVQAIDRRTTSKA